MGPRNIQANGNITIMNCTTQLKAEIMYFHLSLSFPKFLKVHYPPKAFPSQMWTWLNWWLHLKKINRALCLQEGDAHLVAFVGFTRLQKLWVSEGDGWVSSPNGEFEDGVLKFYIKRRLEVPEWLLGAFYTATVKTLSDKNLCVGELNSSSYVFPPHILIILTLAQEKVWSPNPKTNKQKQIKPPSNDLDSPYSQM